MRPRGFLASVLTTVVVVATAETAIAQAPADTAQRLLPVAREIARLGAAFGDSIWPGYRPDTIPVSFVLPSHGDFLYRWRGALPPGYAPVPNATELAWRDQRSLGAANTGTELAGRAVAQVVVNRLDEAELLSTAFHEAFHVFERVSRKPGRRFGGGENSFYVASYPLFDADNETGFAMEAAILGAAMDTRSRAKRRELAQDFVGVRRNRHAHIATEMSQFDQMSEMNEGLAEYALVRSLHILDVHGPPAWKPQAATLLADKRAQLRDMMKNVTQSFRLRFYSTGPAIALLLDALAGDAWKRRLVDEDLTLQDALGLASGVDSIADAGRRRAAKEFDLAERRAEADALMNRIRTGRRARVDSVLSQPGLTVIIAADSLSAKDFNICSFDPQNHLQVSATMQLQTRFWQPCVGRAIRAEFNVPSVHDAGAGTVKAVIGAASDVKLTVDDTPVALEDGLVLPDAKNVKLDAPRASVTAAHASIRLVGNTLLIRALP